MDPEGAPERTNWGRQILKYIGMYWKSVIMIVWPLACLPVPLLYNTPAHRTMYVVMVVAVFWVLEIMPLAVTSLIPMVLLPCLGILSTKHTAQQYMNGTNMMFIGGLMIALAVEYCNLHIRVALRVIKFVGCGPRKLHVGLCLVTMFISMWMSNSAATAMMIPIVTATLKELEAQGFGDMFEKDETENVDKSKLTKEELEEIEEKVPRPTKTTMCYYISTAYSASIGGNGCIIGSGTNLAFKGLYETAFPESDGVEFTKWMALNAPLMLLMIVPSIIYLQVFYMGLFRPKSKDAQRINIGKEGEKIAKETITKKIQDLGKVSFHEVAVGLCFLLSICLWFFRSPKVFPGWADVITDIKVGDATAAMIVVVILFMIPSHPTFIHMFSKDPNKRPKKASPSLVTWKFLQQKTSWGLVFLLGAGFAIAEAAKVSGMNKLIATTLRSTIKDMNKFWIMVIGSLMGAFITQFAANVAVANVLVPVLAEVSVMSKIHPMYLTMPTSLGCSLAYLLPVSTPPNAIAAAPCNMSATEMVKVGIGMTLIGLVCLYVVFPLLGPLVWSDLNGFPKWAVVSNKTARSAGRASGPIERIYDASINEHFV